MLYFLCYCISIAVSFHSNVFLSGATSKKEGEVTVNPPAQYPYTLCPERGPKATGRHPFCWKRGSQGGRTLLGLTSTVLSKIQSQKKHWKSVVKRKARV